MLYFAELIDEELTLREFDDLMHFVEWEDLYSRVFNEEFISQFHSLIFHLEFWQEEHLDTDNLALCWLIRVYMDILPLQVLNTHSIISEACPQSMSMFQQKTTIGHLHKKRLEIIVILNTHESFQKCIQHSHYKCLEQ